MSYFSRNPVQHTPKRSKKKNEQKMQPDNVKKGKEFHVLFFGLQHSHRAKASRVNLLWVWVPTTHVIAHQQKKYTPFGCFAFFCIFRYFHFLPQGYEGYSGGAKTPPQNKTHPAPHQHTHTLTRNHPTHNRGGKSSMNSNEKHKRRARTGAYQNSYNEKEEEIARTHTLTKLTTMREREIVWERVKLRAKPRSVILWIWIELKQQQQQKLV